MYETPLHAGSDRVEPLAGDKRELLFGPVGKMKFHPGLGALMCLGEVARVRAIQWEGCWQAQG